MNKIQFIDLQAQRARLSPNLSNAINAVLEHGQFVFGPEVYELEDKLAEFCGAEYAITCASGTDALELYLMAKNIGPKDAVFVPSFTFASTAEAVALAGGVPVFIDVDEDTFNMDPVSLEQGILKAKLEGLTPKGIIAVDLFGQPADYQSIQAIADNQNLWLLCDAAQSFGGSYLDQKVGTVSDTITSFFPSKPLGCYGDGGAVFTNNKGLADLLKSLRMHGQGENQYDNVRIGLNSRLDTIQAAILLEKLKIFGEEVKARNTAADFYSEGLKKHVKTPVIKTENVSAWAQYTIQLKDKATRDNLKAFLQQVGVPSAVYYIKPLHLQKAYEQFPRAQANLQVSEKLADTVLSLPMHPYLDTKTQELIIEAVVKGLS